MNDLVILLPNSQFSHIFMFEAIEWHFMHVICDVYLNVYLFIAAAVAVIDALVDGVVIVAAVATATVSAIVVAVVVVGVGTIFYSLPPLLLAIYVQYAI